MKNINNKKPALIAILMLAAFGTLSNVPGAMDAIHSTDLLSNRPLYLNNCPVGDEVDAESRSSCRVVHSNKVAANVTITKVTAPPAVKPEGASAGVDGPKAPAVKPVERYKVVSELEAEFCTDGCFMETTVGTIEEAIRMGEKFSKELSENARKKLTEEANKKEAIEKCEIKEDGKPYNSESKVLKCMADRLKTLTGEEAADYYSEVMREKIQELVQSKDPSKRALGMGALGEIGNNLKINCATRPGLNQQVAATNPLMNHANLNPMMTPMRNINQAGTKPGSPRDLIAESACDMWAFGTYNANMEYLQLAATNNPRAAKQAMNTLKAGWGQYFAQRNLALQSDPLGLSGGSETLYNDFLENDAKMKANMAAVVERHKDLMVQPTVENPAQQAANGRLARGGIPPQNSNGAGTPSLGPWPQNGQVNNTANRPLMQPGQPQNGGFRGAPAFGAPVGGAQMAPQSAAPRQAVPPQRPAPALRR